MGEHREDAADQDPAGAVPADAGDDALTGTAMSALPGAQPPQDGGIATALDPGASPLLAPLLAGGVASGQFSIDLDQAPQAIADLEAAADFLKERAQLAHRLATFPAPGADGVSINAADEVSRWASGAGENNLSATLIVGAEQLEEFATKLRGDLQTYLQVDELVIPLPSSGLQA
jgi:hypothetical protein